MNFLVTFTVPWNWESWVSRFDWQCEILRRLYQHVKKLVCCIPRYFWGTGIVMVYRFNQMVISRNPWRATCIQVQNQSLKYFDRMCRKAVDAFSIFTTEGSSIDVTHIPCVSWDFHCILVYKLHFKETTYQRPDLAVLKHGKEFLTRFLKESAST